MVEMLFGAAAFCLFMALRYSAKKYLKDPELFPPANKNDAVSILRYEGVRRYHFSDNEDAIIFNIGSYVFSACKPDRNVWKGHYREVDSKKIEPLTAGKYPEDIYAFDSFKDLFDHAHRISTLVKTGI